MTTNQTIDGVPRWVDKFGAEYRLCPVVGNLQIQVRAAGRPDKWVDVSMTPAHALTNLSPLHAAQPQGEQVHGCQKCNGRGSVPTRHAGEGETAYRDRCKLYAEQLAPVAVARMCDCNQGRLPCTCKTCAYDGFDNGVD